MLADSQASTTHTLFLRMGTSQAKLGGTVLTVQAQAQRCVFLLLKFQKQKNP